MKSKWKLLAVAAAVAVVGIYYYISLPAINIHSSDTWFFIFVVLIAAALVYMSKKKMRSFREAKENRGLRAIGTVIVVLGLFYLAGSLLSSPIINAKKYQKLMKVDEGEFTEDIEELSFDKIPLLDRDTAVILGDRKMGSMVDMVSQFEVDDIYTQINYKDNPVRVSPLRYASLVKWFTNQSEGIPAYIRINMATQTTELVKLEEGMKYTTRDRKSTRLNSSHP